MTSRLLFVVALALIQGLAPVAMAQTGAQSVPALALCDPLLETGVDQAQDRGRDADVATQRHRYDLEKSQPLPSEDAIMDALYEEKWDLKTGKTIDRAKLCQSAPSYVVNWAEIISKNEHGDTVFLAKGLFQFKRDGSFEFVFNKRPYTGTWKVADLKMTLQADWLNKGQPVTGPVEKVRTPVEMTYSDGQADSYDEVVYRVGMFRFQPMDTVVRGEVQDCSCSMK